MSLLRDSDAAQSGRRHNIVTAARGSDDVVIDWSAWFSEEERQFQPVI